MIKLIQTQKLEGINRAAGCTANATTVDRIGRFASFPRLDA